MGVGAVVLKGQAVDRGWPRNSLEQAAPEVTAPWYLMEVVERKEPETQGGSAILREIQVGYREKLSPHGTGCPGRPLWKSPWGFQPQPHTARPGLSAEPAPWGLSQCPASHSCPAIPAI